MHLDLSLLPLLSEQPEDTRGHRNTHGAPQGDNALSPGYLDPFVAVGAGAAPAIAPNLITGAQAPVSGPFPEGRPTFWWGVATAAYQVSSRERAHSLPWPTTCIPLCERLSARGDVHRPSTDGSVVGPRCAAAHRASQ